MWVANLYYWGFNQYIIQRTLAAKSLKESQKGILLAAVLKLILPIIVVIPGIAAFVMIKDTAMYESFKPDNAYPWLLQLLPSGLKGLAFAALTAAIVSIHSLNVEFHIYHFYNGYLQTIYPSKC